VVDWFLFENRRGYCDYYATAMAVMCRVLGIPARIAQGYTSGEYVAAVGGYRVHQLNAHAWPELFFPGHGWIEFEPTSSQPLPARLEGSAIPFPAGGALAPSGEQREDEDRFGLDEQGAEDVEALVGATVQRELWYARLRTALLAALAALLGAALVVLLWWHFGLRGLPAATRAFVEMRRLGRLVGVPQELHQTPAEYGESLARAFEQGKEQIRRLVVLYVKERFSRNGLTEAEVSEVDTLWSGLRGTLLHRALQPRWRKRRASTLSIPPDGLREIESLG
jgi:hypothetical protein